MSRVWGPNLRAALRLATASAVLGIGLVTAASAQGLVPPDFFNAPIQEGAPTAIEADGLTYDGKTNVVTATGGVILRYSGYELAGDRLVYNRVSGDGHFIGAVKILDPSKNLVETNDLVLTGGARTALFDALTITSYDGAKITADSADYAQALETLMENASYAPCGECIDGKGRRVGWSVTTKSLTYSSKDGSLYMDQPVLSVLGIPIAWLPFLYLPDTSETALSRVRMPTIGYSEKYGAKLQVPIAAYTSKSTDLILLPTLLSRQGFLLGAEVEQRFDYGVIQIKASGLYQKDRAPFAGQVGDLDWRGAIQTSGTFRPLQDWTAGWSYTVFTDAAYFEDYDISTAESSVNQVYATNLTDDTYIDVRFQEFKLLGNVTEASQARQAATFPNARFNHVQDLGAGNGRIEITGRLLGVQRGADDDRSTLIDGDGNPVPYNFGYAGNKTHAMFQAGWQDQWIGAGGFVATPYLGGRIDASYYDGYSTSTAAPGETSLWSATPIAAMDVRFPMAASTGSIVHLVEPIGQLVFRGSNTSLAGITNDDAQSFVFDDTNLFSYNRFSGSDRQETGLRANIGGRYLASFADGSYVEVVGGQSFQLAGENAFALANEAQTGIGSGLDATASYAVLGAYGSFVPGLRFGGKVQVDTQDWDLTRASLSGTYRHELGYTLGVNYDVIAANPKIGVLNEQQEIGAEVGIPIADYWTVRANAYWDLTANSYLQYGGGLVYDDGFVVIGGSATQTGPTNTSPNETRFTATFRLKTPAGLDVGYSGAVGLPGQ